MKIITTLTMMFLLSNCYSQDKPCKITKSYDEFTEKTTYEIPYFMISKKSYANGDDPIRISFFRYIYKDGVVSTYMDAFGNREGCKTKNSYIMILFKDGEKMSLYQSGDAIKCGVNDIFVPLTDDKISMFQEKQIDKIRIQLEETNEDFVISEKGQELFSRNLKCISETK
jgi:hypothetical protein